MNYIDLALIVVVVAFGIRGFYHGFVNEIAGMLGIVVGVCLASRYSVDIGQLFSEHLYNLRNETMTNLIGFLLVLALVWILFLAVGVVLGKILIFSGLGIIDRALGFIFSCLKTFLVLSFILYALSKMDLMKNADAYLQEHSEIFPTMKNIASKVMRLDGVRHVEQNLKENLEEMSDDIQTKGKETLDKALDKGVEILKQKAKELPKQSLQSLEPSQETLDKIADAPLSKDKAIDPNDASNNAPSTPSQTQVNP